MKILRASGLVLLALTMGAQAWAQSQASVSQSNRERIKVCRKKGHVPLKPQEPQPVQLKDSEGKITRPTPIYQVPPHFVGSAGTVEVEAVIDEDGCVRQTKIVQSQTADRGVDAEAVKAIEQWVFLPATQNGHPVKVFYVLTFNTRIQ
jgi:TonB family protein